MAWPSAVDKHVARVKRDEAFMMMMRFHATYFYDDDEVSCYISSLQARGPIQTSTSAAPPLVNPLQPSRPRPQPPIHQRAARPRRASTLDQHGTGAETRARAWLRRPRHRPLRHRVKQVVLTRREVVGPPEALALVGAALVVRVAVELNEEKAAFSILEHRGLAPAGRPHADRRARRRHRRRVAARMSRITGAALLRERAL